MCGISCAVALRGHGPLHHSRKGLEHTIRKSLDKIKYRGPDASGSWISEDFRVALGHNRLAIVDLTPESEQPFHDANGNIHAVVNGELYGYKEIRDDLEAKGYRFRTQCDSEIVIALYQEHGISFLSHLRGEFALCLYDSESQFFMAAVDRYSIKPLFYTTINDKLLIASEMKAFLPFGWQPEWDVQAIKDGAMTLDRRTIYSGVQKVLPGQYLVLNSFNNLSQSQYWDLEFKDKREIEHRSEEEMIEGVRKRLLDATRDRLRADVPVGVFLSGGIDSSAIAGMIKHLTDTEGATVGTLPASERLNCFSVKFMDKKADEEPVARRTAEWLGVKMHHVEMTEERFVENFADAVWHNEVPANDLGTVGKHLLSKLTRDTGIKVVLTGEGSDEHFAGYQDFLTDYLREPDLAWPPSSELSEEERLQSLEESKKTSMFGDKVIQTPALRQVNNTTFINLVGRALHVPTTIMSQWPLREFGESERCVTAINAVDGRTRTLMNTKWHPLHTSLYLWTKTGLANDLLTKLGDRCEMSHSVEGRQPFLDHRLSEYVMGLPPSLKWRWDPKTRTFSEKWVLKEAMRPFITDELYKRKKAPYIAPAMYDLEGPIYKLLRTLIIKENIDRLGFLDWNACKSLVSQAGVGTDIAQGKTFRIMLMVAQFVILQQKFGVKTARPEYAKDLDGGEIVNGCPLA